MGLFTKVRRALIVSKFKRHDLKIIQAIPTDKFATIIFEFKEKGWEVAGVYGDFDISVDAWEGKLRKGTSVLTCKWNPTVEGEIVGLTRIVEGIGKDYDLAVQPTPNW